MHAQASRAFDPVASSPASSPALHSALRFYSAIVLTLVALRSAAPRLEAQSVYETPYTFARLAGNPGLSADGTGAAATFNAPSGVAVDAQGNVYIADTQNHVIRKVTSGGVVTTMAGVVGSFGSEDGAGSMARFDGPIGIAVDDRGNVLVADSANSTIRRISPEGVVTTVAGQALTPGFADGAGSAARFAYPSGVALDHIGNLYVVDSRNRTVRKIASDGTVTTVAGLPNDPSFDAVDGIGSAARFAAPYKLAVDPSGNIFVSDGPTIRKITAAGVITTVAGTFDRPPGSNDGVAGTARFDHPGGLAIDGSGNLFVADAFNHTIRKLSPAGIVTTFAGAAGRKGWDDGLGGAARFDQPADVAVDGRGNLFVVEAGNYIVRKITTAGDVTTLAGLSPGVTFADGAGGEARFDEPSGVALDRSGNAYVADSRNHNIRKITPVGVVTTVAGLAGSRGSTDGTGIAARFDTPVGIAMDAGGNLIVADGNHTIRKITAAGVVTTVAGVAGSSGAVDGEARVARFTRPLGVAVDTAGNIFIADGSHTIRRLSPAGIVTTVAGLAGSAGFADGVGSAARFDSPRSLAIDHVDNIFVTDNSNAIRKITPQGVVTTFAGQASRSGFTDGALNVALFARPLALAFDGHDNLYVADALLIRRISPSGVVTTLAGLAQREGLIEGTGAAARFSFPIGLVADADGNLVVADSIVIRRGVPALIASPEARLANLSVRKAIGPDSLVAGFVLSGLASKPMLIRAVGPGLGQFGVANPLPSPSLLLVRTASPSDSFLNAGWEGSAALSAAFASVGAFPLPIDSTDSAIVATVPAGNYTAQTTGPSGLRGEVLVEVYDAAPENRGLRLVNLSARAHASSGADVLSAGFVVVGGNMRVLIRAVGPGLERFGVTGVLAAPLLTVFSGSAPIATNAAWGNTAELKTTFDRVGAFALLGPSADAAVLLTLGPGSYTAQVTGAGSAAGTALIEIYEVPVP